jgi:hypothetical protein
LGWWQHLTRPKLRGRHTPPTWRPIFHLLPQKAMQVLEM